MADDSANTDNVDIEQEVPETEVAEEAGAEAQRPTGAAGRVEANKERHLRNRAQAAEKERDEATAKAEAYKKELDEIKANSKSAAEIELKLTAVDILIENGLSPALRGVISGSTPDEIRANVKLLKASLPTLPASETPAPTAEPESAPAPAPKLTAPREPAPKGTNANLLEVDTSRMTPEQKRDHEAKLREHYRQLL